MNKGFTLIELLVTIGVTVIISSLVLANFPDFSRRLELSRTAQAIALSFREAEGAALGVREFDGIFPAYGLHCGSLPAKSYFLFANLNKDGVYDKFNDPQVDEFEISGLSEIFDLCGRQIGALLIECGLGELDVVFVRPAPKVFIKSGVFDFEYAEIKIRLPATDEQKKIAIWSTGQLSIE